MAGSQDAPEAARRGLRDPGDLDRRFALRGPRMPRKARHCYRTLPSAPTPASHRPMDCARPRARHGRERLETAWAWPFSDTAPQRAQNDYGGEAGPPRGGAFGVPEWPRPDRFLLYLVLCADGIARNPIRGRGRRRRRGRTKGGTGTMDPSARRGAGGATGSEAEGTSTKVPPRQYPTIGGQARRALPVFLGEPVLIE